MVYSNIILITTRILITSSVLLITVQISTVAVNKYEQQHRSDKNNATTRSIRHTIKRLAPIPIETLFFLIE